MATINNCRKFSANMFDKSKCQNCFKPKETHSAEALECNKIARKISKFAYLFVAPETFDFNNAMDKSRRWQRRFFVLYDDGELTYSVDENVNTVPQGVIDMNICTNVYDAEEITGHEFSICVATEEKRTFIKGNGKEEITRWFDVLVMYPRSQQKTKKHRRAPTFQPPPIAPLNGDEAAAKRVRYHTLHAATIATENGADSEPEIDVDVRYGDDSVADIRSRGLMRSRSDRGVNIGSGEDNNVTLVTVPETPPAIHYRGIRSLKHKHDKNYQEGLKKSSSFHDIPGKDGDKADSKQMENEAQKQKARLRSKSTERSLYGGGTEFTLSPVTALMTRAARRRTVSREYDDIGHGSGSGDGTLIESYDACTTIDSLTDVTSLSAALSSFHSDTNPNPNNKVNQSSFNLSIISPHQRNARFFSDSTLAISHDNRNMSDTFGSVSTHSPRSTQYSIHGVHDLSTDSVCTTDGYLTTALCDSSTDNVFHDTEYCSDNVVRSRSDALDNHVCGVSNTHNNICDVINQSDLCTSTSFSQSCDSLACVSVPSPSVSPSAAKPKTLFEALLTTSPLPPHNAPQTRTKSPSNVIRPKSPNNTALYTQLASLPTEYPIDNYVMGDEKPSPSHRHHRISVVKPPLFPIDLAVVTVKNKVANTARLFEDRSRASREDMLSMRESAHRARSAPAVGRRRKGHKVEHVGEGQGRRTRTPSPPNIRRRTPREMSCNGREKSLSSQTGDEKSEDYSSSGQGGGGHRVRSPTRRSGRSGRLSIETAAPMQQMDENEVKNLIALVVGKGKSWEELENRLEQDSKSSPTRPVRQLLSPQRVVGEKQSSTKRSHQRISLPTITPPKRFNSVESGNNSSNTSKTSLNSTSSVRDYVNNNKNLLVDSAKIIATNTDRDQNHSNKINHSKQSQSVSAVESPTQSATKNLSKNLSKLAQFRSPTKAHNKNEHSLSALKAKRNAKKTAPLASRSPTSDRSLLSKDPHPVIIPQSTRQGSERSASPPPARSTGGRSSGSAAITGSTASGTENTTSGAAGNDVTVGDNKADRYMYRSRSPTSSLLLNGRNKNETDEHKMAKTLTRETSSPRQSPSRKADDIRSQDDLKYMKKGWLLKHRENEWIKHWFVLSGTALKFFADAKAEEQNNLDGVIELKTCSEVKEVAVSRNYGFRIKLKITVGQNSKPITSYDIRPLPVTKYFGFSFKTADGEFVLSAMTSGIRTNWVQAIQKCMESGNNTSQNKYSSAQQASPAQAKTLQTVSSSPASTSQSQQQQNTQNTRISEAKTSSPEKQQTAQQQKAAKFASSSSASSQNEAEIQSEDASLSHSYPAVKLRPKTRDTRQRLQQQENRRSLDLLTLESGQGQSDISAIDRRVTLDDYSMIARQLEKDNLKRQDSQDSLQSTEGMERTPRRRRREKQHKHRVSCTWPYEGSTEAPPDPGALAGLEAGSKSEASGFSRLEDTRQRNLSGSENVDPTALRAHNRLSLLEEPKRFAQQKNEVGPAFKEPPKETRKVPLSERILADLALSPRETVKSSSQTTTESSGDQSSSATSSGHSHSPSPARTLDSTTSPRYAHKSQASQVKAKSRSSQGQMKEGQMKVKDEGGGLDEAMGVDSVEARNEIIEQKWRERNLSGPNALNKTEVEANSAPRFAANIPTPSGNTVTQLLETEVETLKAQLERTQQELTSSRRSENVLKVEVQALKGEPVVAMETDQSRAQDQAEQSAEQLHARLTEQENRNEMTKLQVNSLRSQLQEAKDTVTTQQQQMVGLRSKLESTNKELTDNKAKQIHETSLQQKIIALEKKVHALESDVKTHTTSLAKKDLELSQYQANMHQYAEQIEAKDDRIDTLEAEMHSLIALKEELNEKSDLIGHLGDELEVSKQQLRKQDGVMQKAQKDFSQRVKQMEDEFYKEKENLESTIEQYKARLQKALEESNMTDHITHEMHEKDETIAQLEERVIENDTRLEELKEELNEVYEENHKMAARMQEICDVRDKAQSEAEATKKEVVRLKNQLTSVNSDIEQMKMKKDALAGDKSSLVTQIEELQEENATHAQEALNLQQVLHDLTEDMQHVNDKYIVKAQECETLKAAQSDHSELESKLMTSQSDLDMARERITELESQLLHQSETSSNVTDKQKEVDQLCEKLQEYAHEAEQWQDKYIEQSDECERLREIMAKNESDSGVNQQIKSDLEAAHEHIRELQRELQDQQGSFERELEDRYKEVSEAQNVLGELQERLNDSENSCREQSAMLAELREKELLRRGSASDIGQTLGDSEIAQKYKDTVKDLKQTRMLLQETVRKREELDTFNVKLKQELRNIEMDHEEKLAAAKKKVTDLTSKLQGSERRLKRLDKRRSSAAPVDDDFKTISTQTEGNASLDAPSQPPASADSSNISRDLAIAQTKSRELSKQLQGYRNLEIDIQNLRKNEIRLKEENTALSESIMSLQSQFEKVTSAEYKDTGDVVGRLVELESRLGSVQMSLTDCQSKLSSSIGHLRARGAGEVANELVAVNNQLNKLTKVNSKDTIGLSEKDRTRIFGEKLALEALVLSELAYNVKTKELDTFSRHENVICELESAKHGLACLQQVLTLSGTQVSESQLLKEPSLKRGSLEYVSHLLAQKIQLCNQISNLVASEQQTPFIDKNVPHVDDSTSEQLSNETLFRVFADEKLQNSSHLLSPVSSFPNTLVQRDLNVILAKVKDTVEGSLSESARQQIEQRDIETGYEWVQTELSQIDGQVAHLVDSLVNSLANLCARDIIHTAVLCQRDISSRSGAQVPFKEVLPRVFDMEEMQTEMQQVVNKLVYSTSPVTSEKSKDKTALVIECVQKETSVLCNKLFNALESKLEKAPQTQLSEDEKVANQKERNSIAMEVCKVIVQHALVNAQVTYVHQILTDSPASKSDASGRTSEFKLPLRRNDSGVVVHSISLPTSPVEQMPDKLAACLQQEATAKSDIASYLVHKSTKGASSPRSSLKDQIALLASELIGVDRSLVQNSKMVDIYGDFMCREAVLQAQLSYTTNLLTLQHQQELDQLKCEAEMAHQKSVAKQDQHIQGLKAHIKQLQAEVKGTESRRIRESVSSRGGEHSDEKSGYESHIKSLEEHVAHSQAELESSLQDRYDLESHLTSLEEELGQKTEAVEHLVTELYEESQRYESIIAELESRIAGLEQDEAQSKDDVRLAMQAVSSHEVVALEEQVTRLRTQLDQQRTRHMSEIEQLREELCKDSESATQAVQKSKIQQLELKIKNLQADYEAELDLSRSAHRRELERSKDDMLSQLAAAEASSLAIDEDTIRQRYEKEIDKIKGEFYDKSFGAMEKSHQKVISQMRREHNRELDLLRQEKDQVLEEETKATQAALDAMRKAHEAELQRERNKILDMLAKTHSAAELDSIQYQHEETLNALQEQLRKLSEQFSIKCLENESLRKRLELQTNMLHDSRKRAQELIAKNDELNTRVRHDIDKLNKMVAQSRDLHQQEENESAEMYELKVSLKIKEAETAQLSSELEDHKAQIRDMSQELDASVEKYSDLYDEKKRLEDEIRELQRVIDDVTGSHESSPMSPSHQGSPSGSGGYSDDSGERSPSPKRSRVRGGNTRSDLPDIAERGAVGGVGHGRLLPTLPPDARSKKQNMWRQRQPERARSNPGPISHGTLLSTPPSKPAATPPAAMAAAHYATSSLDRGARKKLPRIVDVDIIEEL